MSGHSKWAQIKRQKSTNDARRGQLFTKLGREITVAARAGGPDPETNVRLRLAIQRARSFNMPAENIERAIKRAAGESEGAHLEEVTYEGYGPGGAALFVEALTDNRNRTVAEVRNVFARSGGGLGESGSVAWQFESRGVITVALSGRDPEEVGLLAIDAGAVDMTQDGEVLDIYTEPADLEQVRAALETAGVTIEQAEVTYVPKTLIALDEQKTAQVMRLIERLEELDNVQRVHTNLEIPPAVLAALAGAA